MNGYKCFYKGNTCEVYTDTSWMAQEMAARIFKAKKSYEVSVFLCEKIVDGEVQEVIHAATF